jgi:hypothetical protein
MPKWYLHYLVLKFCLLFFFVKLKGGMSKDQYNEVYRQLNPNCKTDLFFEYVLDFKN